MIRLFLIIIFGISTILVRGNQVVDISILPQNEIVQLQDNQLLNNLSIPLTQTKIEPKNKKLKAILLTILLGHFGVHRIYLGTSANVPVVYSLTLGGGLGLLPFIDLVAIITTKDLSQYSNNDKVFMWIK